jgi:hypothetical protein
MLISAHRRVLFRITHYAMEFESKTRDFGSIVVSINTKGPEMMLS